MEARAVYRRWLGYAIDEALKRGLLEPPQLISHASPDVMVTQLPRELTAQLLEKSLESGVAAIVGPEVAPQVTIRPPRAADFSEVIHVASPTVSTTTSAPRFAVCARTACPTSSLA